MSAHARSSSSSPGLTSSDRLRWSIWAGPGGLTATLLDRWPDAAVVGVDSSADMIEAAAEHAVAGRLSFVHADIASWQPQRPIDVVVANAVLQWVADHLELLPRIVSWLRPGGALAFQVPDNFDEPSHTLLRDLRTSARWREQLGADADRSAGVEHPETYLETLAGLGLRADVWQTTYLHLLSGDDPVLEWVREPRCVRCCRRCATTTTGASSSPTTAPRSALRIPRGRGGRRTGSAAPSPSPTASSELVRRCGGYSDPASDNWGRYG